MRFRRRYWATLVGASALAITLAARGAAQGAPTREAAAPRLGCDGDTITSIEIHAHSASSVVASDDLWKVTSAALAGHFARTNPAVIERYLRVAVGHGCWEIDRSETERILRAQPFIALASVRAVSDGRGHTRLHVDVVDEYPLIVSGGLNRGQIGSVTLGTQNFRGRGLTFSVNGTRGFAYRNGFGADVAQYGAFGGPYYVAAGAARNPLGENAFFEFVDPFLTDLQRTASVASVKEASEYYSVLRPVSDAVALLTHRVSYNLGWVRRFGRLDRRHTVGFVGGTLIGEQARISADAMIVSDSGLVDVPDAAFPRDYPTFKVAHLAGIGGLRAIRFITVRGFDALSAEQDLGIGAQLHLLAGPSVFEPPSGRDVFVSGDLYAGVGSATSFFAAHYVGEARRNYNTGSWDGMVSSGRISWYGKSSPASTRIASVTVSALRHLDFPAQLTFRDADGGLEGFPDSRAGGGNRAVVRIEERRAIRLFPTRADAAVAAFASAGKLWAGDVPYGTTTPIRTSVGVSLLAAVPVGAKRTYRVDVSMPINREPGGARYELRFTWIDRTRLLWREPHDVSRVRTGAVPSNLMKW